MPEGSSDRAQQVIDSVRKVAKAKMSWGIYFCVDLESISETVRFQLRDGNKIMFE